MSTVQLANITFDSAQNHGIKIYNSNNMALYTNSKSHIILNKDLSTNTSSRLTSNSANMVKITGSGGNIVAKQITTNNVITNGAINVSGNLYVNKIDTPSINVAGSTLGVNKVWTLLSVITASNTSAIENYSTSDLANYRAVKLTFIDVNTSGSNSPLTLYLASNATTYIQTGGGNYSMSYVHGVGMGSNGTNLQTDSSMVTYNVTAPGIIIGGNWPTYTTPISSNVSVVNYNGSITLYDFAATQRTKFMGEFFYANNTTNDVRPLLIKGMENTLLPMVGIRLSCLTAAPVINGTIILEGIHMNV